MKEEYKEFIGIYDESVPVELCNGFVENYVEMVKDEQEYNSARENYYDTSFKPKCTNYYGGDDPPAVDNRPVDYYWTEPKQKDPGADYKPGKFKYLDEAIKNTKKDS